VALLHHWVGLLIGLTLITAPLGRAIAESEVGRPMACFEVTVTQARPSLTDAILLNRCSGETWLLVRTHKTDHLAPTTGGFVYRWRPIAIDWAEKAVPLSPQPLPTIAKPTAKCFVFDGRQFCE
jgi:hypothetical protein